ncbi:flagellar hook assembly protein FlgD [Marmoricola sp. RAF53]|uniref:flagellar hook assembly protein FlgD n=1 Tax=Marmoricola sp. RAF53 TaxID=3233059 RepID=UPI003F9688CD
MSVSATEGVTSGMFSTPDAKAGSKTSSTDKDMFLQLLVAQMKYQDPMNPTDSSQFLAQSAQFTALEKMQDVADKTAQLFSAQVSFGASGLIGRSVTWVDDKGATQSGTVHGVNFGADGPVLDVGNGTTLPIASVLTVGDGSSPSGSSTTSA